MFWIRGHDQNSVKPETPRKIPGDTAGTSWDELQISGLFEFSTEVF